MRSRSIPRFVIRSWVSIIRVFPLVVALTLGSGCATFDPSVCTPISVGGGINVYGGVYHCEDTTHTNVPIHPDWVHATITKRRSSDDVVSRPILGVERMYTYHFKETVVYSLYAQFQVELKDKDTGAALSGVPAVVNQEETETDSFGYLVIEIQDDAWRGEERSIPISIKLPDWKAAFEETGHAVEYSPAEITLALHCAKALCDVVANNAPLEKFEFQVKQLTHDDEKMVAKYKKKMAEEARQHEIEQRRAAKEERARVAEEERQEKRQLAQEKMRLEQMERVERATKCSAKGLPRRFAVFSTWTDYTRIGWETNEIIQPTVYLGMTQGELTKATGITPKKGRAQAYITLVHEGDYNDGKHHRFAINTSADLIFTSGNPKSTKAPRLSGIQYPSSQPIPFLVNTCDEQGEEKIVVDAIKECGSGYKKVEKVLDDSLRMLYIWSDSRTQMIIDPRGCSTAFIAKDIIAGPQSDSPSDK